MTPLETIGLVYTLFAVLAFTGGMLILAWFGFKALVGTITVRVTEEKSKEERLYETDREQATIRFK